MFSNFYEDSFTLIDVLESELKNFEEHMNSRDEMLVVNLLYFLKLKGIETEEYFNKLKSITNKKILAIQKV
jgi:hypothetical protein